MDIIFGNNKIKKICSYAKGKLKRRLDDIRAAENMVILKKLPGRCHPLKADRKGQWAIDLEHPHRLIFELIGDPIPISKDGRLDLQQITAVKLIEVEDYHGK